jgi:hypothetical protein
MFLEADILMDSRFVGENEGTKRELKLFRRGTVSGDNLK